MEFASKKENQCGMRCEIWSRVCGYYRPVSNWNKGKQEEFVDRHTFTPPTRAEVAKKAK